MLLLNIAVSRKNYRTWVDVAAFIIIAIPVFFVYYHACIGYFSVFFHCFSSVAVFILGIRNSFYQYNMFGNHSYMFKDIWEDVSKTYIW